LALQNFILAVIEGYHTTVDIAVNYGTGCAMDRLHGDGFAQKKPGTAPVFYCFRGLPIAFGFNTRPNNSSNLVTKGSSPTGRPVEVHPLISFNIHSSSGIARYLPQSSMPLINEKS